MGKGRRTWLEINMDQIIKNIDAVRSNMKPETALCAVIKCDAYGMGALEFSRILDNVDTVDFFATVCLDEAVYIRNGGARKPTLVLGYIDPLTAPEAADYDISVCCFSLDYAKALNDNMEGRGKKLNVHLKIDTGMSRLGILNQRKEDFEPALDEAQQILELPNLEFEGVFTHFAHAYDTDRTFTDYQYANFMQIVNALKERGHDFKYIHCNNSPGGSYHPDKQCSMARPGTTMYGYPMDPTRPVEGLMPVLSWRAKVAQIKELQPGAVISYGCTYKVKEPMRIAVVTIGYADGIYRNFEKDIKFLVNGKLTHSLGTVCMDTVMIDITHIEGVTEGQTVTLIGEDHGAYLPAEELGEYMGVHPLLMNLYVTRRVERVYFLNGKEVSVTNYLREPW